MRLMPVLCLGLKAMVLAAAPALESKSMMYNEEEWTIHNLSRSCGSRRHHAQGKEYGKDHGHGHGHNHGQHGHYGDDRYGYEKKGHKGQTDYHGSNRYGYSPEKHKQSNKSSHGLEDSYHPDNSHKGYGPGSQISRTPSTTEAQPAQSKASIPTGMAKRKTSQNDLPVLTYTAMTGSNVAASIGDITTHEEEEDDDDNDDDNDKCHWSFTVVTQQRGRQHCSFEAGRRALVSASDISCGGHFSVSSGWSGQFGEGQGFTTLSVVDRERKLIVWPAYRDAQLVDGKVARPDQRYVPQRLP